MKSLSRVFLLFFVCRYIETQSVVSSPTKERISVRKCDEYRSLIEKKVRHCRISLVRSPETCSTRTRTFCPFVPKFLLASLRVTVGEFPHMAAIGFEIVKSDGSTDIKFVCGGSLISEQHVLTAAHCSDLGDGEGFVRLGSLNTKIDKSSDFGMSEFIKHENYNRRTRQNDIAIIKLSRAVELDRRPNRPDSANQQIRPACLAEGFKNHETAIATGWTNTHYRVMNDSSVLSKAKLDIFDVEKCAYHTYNDDDIVIDDKQICAGYMARDYNICNGDSGAPIQVLNEQNECVAHIIGINSVGSGACGSKSPPAVYARIASYLDWIEEKVWPGQ